MSESDKKISRRRSLQTLGLLSAGVALSAMGVCEQPPNQNQQHKTTKEKPMTTPSTSRMPAIFLPHGGGPWPFTNEPLFGSAKMWEDMSNYMKKLGQIPPSKPKAVLVISAHWEESVPTVQATKKPPMYYDYYGFPPESYEVQWPSPGAPELAGEILSLLQRAGLKTGKNDTRGFDHGTFVPLKLAYPDADIPTLQLSLKQGLDPKEHIKIGRAIAPLLEQGVFMIGSGMSYHNLRELIQYSGREIDHSKAFDEWLGESMLLDADKRETRLVEWLKAPNARLCHPREEHLIPLHVIAGAAGDAKATLPYRDVVMGAHLSAVHFG